MRPCGVAALAFDKDLEQVGRRHHRPGPQRELSDRKTGHVVHAIDFLNPEPLHHAVVHHLAPAAAAFFGGLEDNGDGPVEVPRLGQVLGGTEQHRGVPVMSTGVHLAGNGRLVRDVARFLHRQGIHVGAQPDDLPRSRLPTLDDADDPRLTDPGDDFVAAPRGQFLGDNASSPMHVELQFRVHVNVAAPGGDVVMEIGEPIYRGHEGFLLVICFADGKRLSGSHVIDQPAHEALTCVQLRNGDELVRLMGLRDRARPADACRVTAVL